MGLHIPNPLAQFIGFLGASAARLVWNRLHLAFVDVMQQGSEDLPSSLNTDMCNGQQGGKPLAHLGERSAVGLLVN
uniref:Uncharacterized protein n=1 Tax=Oryza punctata TaxID=4537 RepID=A0A0E0KS21_ORYPU